MSTIVTRASNGGALSHTQLDDNFTNLNNDKYESGDAATFQSLNVYNIGGYSYNYTYGTNASGYLMGTSSSTKAYAGFYLAANNAYMKIKTNNSTIGNFYYNRLTLGSDTTSSIGTFSHYDTTATGPTAFQMRSQYVDVRIGSYYSVTGMWDLTKQYDSGFAFGDYGILPSRSVTYPSWSDNSLDLGSSSYRWDDVYATNGTIQTSDERLKQDVAELTPAEMAAAKEISKLFKTYRWIDAVERKGDAARTHAGVIAQQVQAVMTAQGLNASDYAFFIEDIWWEKEHFVDYEPATEAVMGTDEQGNEVVIEPAKEAVEAHTWTQTWSKVRDEQPVGNIPADAVRKDRLGIRYPELLSFLAAYNEQRFALIEARLDALEGA